MEIWVYILKCSDNTYYTGLSLDVDPRLFEHETGFYPNSYTASRRPVKLMWMDDFPDFEQAFEVERQIKGWSRKKKEALIAGDFNLLHELAQSKEMVERRKKRKTKSR